MTSTDDVERRGADPAEGDVASDAHESSPEAGATRRGFLGGAAGIAAGLALAAPADATEAQTVERDERLGRTVAVALTVNGRRRRVRVDPRTSLLDLLRDRFALTGTKKGCNQGACGACTVLLDGRRVVSCLVMAAGLDGADVATIEGLAEGEELHPVQAAFISRDAFQCGFCTSGQIMAAVALLEEIPRPTREQIREGLNGNLCRCSAYTNIVEAVLDAAKAS